MKKCYLDNVPKIPYKDKWNCDWQNSIGIDIAFEYEGIKGTFKIIGYESRDKVYVEYKGKQYMLYGKYIKKNKIAKIFEKKVEWFYEEGEIIQDHKRKLKILKRKYVEKNKNPNVRNHKYYQYKCLICGYDCTMDDFWANEVDLKAGKGCGCCAGTKVVVGINDISTTLPWAVPYIDDINYVYTHTKTSQKKTDMTCPACGFKKRTSVDKLYYQSFGCPKCSDGYSYPEKFFFNILEQADIKFKYQYGKSDALWCGKYKYDFYLPDYNCIVEINGRQHYEDDWKDYKLQHKIDVAKKKLALNNGVDRYIEIDCRESDKDFIKQSIINSNLPFNVKDIDYNQADKAALTNKLIQTCEIYNTHSDITIKAIAFMIDVSIKTVICYLKKGRELGLCEYRDEIRKKRRN